MFTRRRFKPVRSYTAVNLSDNSRDARQFSRIALDRLFKPAINLSRALVIASSFRVLRSQCRAAARSNNSRPVSAEGRIGVSIGGGAKRGERAGTDLTWNSRAD